MKTKISLFIIFLFFSFTVNAQKSANITPPNKLNPLELALDFDKGTKTAWTDLGEDGGLNKHHYWYGISINSAENQRGRDGLVSDIMLTLDPYRTPTIKEIKTAINSFCGLTNADWKNDEIGGPDNRYSSEAYSDKCKTVFFTNFILGRGVWTINISKRKVK